jgi:iron complex transport system substrate-binding protein
MLELAGAENAVTGFEGFKPLTAEAAVAARPDVVVVSRSTLERLGGVSGLLDVPGLAGTPAGREGRVVTVEILSFIGFGPRTADALVELLRALHPELEGV